MKFLVFLLCIIPLLASAADVRLIKARIQTTEPVVLGQISVIKSESEQLVAQLKAFQVEFNSSGELTKASLQEQLESRFEDKSFRILGWNKVKKFSCAVINTQELEKQVKRYLNELIGSQDARVDRVRLSEKKNLPCLTTQGAALTLIADKRSHIFKSMRFSFITEKQKLHTINFETVISKRVQYTGKSYQKGVTLRAKDLISSWENATVVRTSSEAHTGTADQLVTLKALKKGIAVNNTNVRNYGGVSEGQNIKLLMQKNGIRVEASAKALSYGSIWRKYSRCCSESNRACNGKSERRGNCICGALKGYFG